MHNNIMAAGSKDHPPMLGPGRYSQWRSRFLRYIDTKPNGEGLRKSILSGPYVPSIVLVQVVAATEGNPAIQQHTTIETVLNMTPENKEHFLSEKEAIFLLLTGIGDDIYSTVDACKTANEMWIAIERLQQGESLNVQDVKTNMFWEFRKFTSHDGESMESYYSRFYKLMNEFTRSNLQVTTIANPLALLAAAQPYSDNYYQAPKPQRTNATSSSTRPSSSTRHKGKEIAKPVTPQSESVSDEDSDPEQAQRDKEMQKNLALLAKTSHVNAVCAECGKCVFNSNHDACVSRYLNDVNARTKKPKVVPISASKPKIKANKSVATQHKKTVASDTTIQKSKSYHKELYENTNPEWKWWIAKRCPSGYKWTQKPLRTKKIWMPKIRKDDVSTSISPTIDIVSRITNIVAIHLFIVDSRLHKEMTGKSAGCVICREIIGIQGEHQKFYKDFLTMIQRNLQAQVITVRTDRGTKFLNKTLHAYFKEEGIEHQTSTPQTPEHNGVVERQNRTLVEAARTMLSASKLPLSFWTEAVTTACYTENRSIIISAHGKMAYHIINDWKPSIKHLHIFGCICYITRDGENLDKMKEKGDPCVMVGYSTQSKGYRVYNKRTRLIVESIHIKFDEIKEMMSDHNSSDLAPQRQEMSVENVTSGLVPQG
ncbi:retrovirus-related pol polyprotein from transposon TNT 1-94 [Tanacetum coccineum]